MAQPEANHVFRGSLHAKPRSSKATKGVGACFRLSKLLQDRMQGVTQNVRVRNGFVPALRTTVFRKFRGLETHKCPFANLPESEKGRWGEGLTAADMEKCVWLKPKLVAAIEYAEWTPANHLRHSRFVALREDKDPRQVKRE